MIEDSPYVGIRLKHGMNPIGIEQGLISRLHTEKHVISRRLVTCAVLDKQARLIPNDIANEDNNKRVAIASKQHSEWSRAQEQAVGYFHALIR